MSWNKGVYVISSERAKKMSGIRGHCPKCDSTDLKINYNDSIVYCPCGGYDNIFTSWLIEDERD